MQAAALVDLQDYTLSFDAAVTTVATIAAIIFLRKRRYLWTLVAGLIVGSDLSDSAPIIHTVWMKSTTSATALSGIVLANMVWWTLLKNVMSKARSDEQLKERIATVGGSAVALLMMYAHIFEVLGLKDTGPQTITHNIFNSLYFTIATWTTVGYGDLVPFDWWTKFFAALAALNGYVLLAVFISTLVPIFLPQSTSSFSPDGRE